MKKYLMALLGASFLLSANAQAISEQQAQQEAAKIAMESGAEAAKAVWPIVQKMAVKFGALGIQAVKDAFSRTQDFNRDNQNQSAKICNRQPHSRAYWISGNYSWNGGDYWFENMNTDWNAGVQTGGFKCKNGNSGSVECHKTAIDLPGKFKGDAWACVLTPH